MRGIVWIAASIVAGAVAVAPPVSADDDLEDRVFFSQLADDPSFLTVDRDDLVRVAHDTCDAFGNLGKAETISRFMDAGMPLKHAMKLTLAAATAYCPEYLADLR